MPGNLSPLADLSMPAMQPSSRARGRPLWQEQWCPVVANAQTTTSSTASKEDCRSRLSPIRNERDTHHHYQLKHWGNISTLLGLQNSRPDTVRGEAERSDAERAQCKLNTHSRDVPTPSILRPEDVHVVGRGGQHLDIIRHSGWRCGRQTGCGPPRKPAPRWTPRSSGREAL